MHDERTGVLSDEVIVQARGLLRDAGTLGHPLGLRGASDAMGERQFIRITSVRQLRFMTAAIWSFR